MRRLLLLAASLLFFVPEVLFAADDPLASVKCTGLIGCGGGMANILLISTIPAIAKLLLQLVAGLAVLFVGYSGCMIVFSMGDESKVTTARTQILYTLAGLAVAMCAGTIVSLVVTEKYLPYNPPGTSAVLLLIGSAVRIGVLLFNVAFTVIIIFAGMRMVLAQGKSDEFGNAMKMLTYAVIGAIVVNLARALVLVVAFLGF